MMRLLRRLEAMHGIEAVPREGIGIKPAHLDPGSGDGVRPNALRDWLGKRLIGAANLLAGRRSRFADTARKLEALERFRREQQVELVVFTGDYTALGLDGEFERARAFLEPLMQPLAGFGELGLAVWLVEAGLPEPEARQAADGWDADRAWWLDCPGDPRLAWLIQLDTLEEAAELNRPLHPAEETEADEAASIGERAEVLFKVSSPDEVDDEVNAT